MGSKYREYASNRKTSAKEYQRIHPVWRGVGFAMIVLIPIISWAGADEIITRNLIELPADLIAGPGQFFFNLFQDPLIHIRLMLFVGILLGLFAIFTMVVFLANSLFGVSPRNDPFYVPPISRRPRKRR